LSDQTGVKIIFKGNNNSLKVYKNYFCNGTKNRLKEWEILRIGNLNERNPKTKNIEGYAKILQSKHTF
jgi:hypothetical protein